MKRTRLVVDMSSIMWTCLRAGKSKDSYFEDWEGKTVEINPAIYGYDNALNAITNALKESNLVPMDMVMVFEGLDSKKARLNISNTYKANRGKDAPGWYKEFQALRDMLQETFLGLGALMCWQDGVEGDDVIGYLAQQSEDDLIVMTNDNDLAVVNGTNEYGAKVSVRVNGEYGHNKYGPFPFDLIPLYKAVVGDSSDGIKGIKGFGPKAWEELYLSYDDDGCRTILQLLRTGQRDTLATYAVQNKCKLLKKIEDNWNDAAVSLALAQLMVHRIDTVDHTLHWKAGMVRSTERDPRLSKWRQQLRLVTSENYDQALAFLQSTLQNCSRTVAVDVETTTNEESDQWLEGIDEPDGVDQLGAELAGFSITFGENGQFTYYVSVKHFCDKNISMSQARKLLEVLGDRMKVIHNTYYELSVFYQAADEDGTLWRDHWKNNGQHGMLTNIEDTLFMASYVNENDKLGLKHLSKRDLDYDQIEFNDMRSFPAVAEVKQVEVEGAIEERTIYSGPYPGGKVVTVHKKIPVMDENGVPVEVPVLDRRTGDITGYKSKTETKSEVMIRYKMSELPPEVVKVYGADDTITALAHWNHFSFRMRLEHTYNVYRQVEIDAAYLHAKNFVDGFRVSLGTLHELEKNDDKTYNDAEAVLHAYLLAQGWEGTVKPVYDIGITAKEIKEAYAIVTGQVEEDEEAEGEGEEPAAKAPKDPLLSSKVRTPAKLLAIVREIETEEATLFADALEALLEGNADAMNALIDRKFDGKPRFKASNKQMVRLLYEVMGLPVRVRNKVTATMRKQGVKEGNPKGDSLALQYAKRDAEEMGHAELVSVLKAIELMTMVSTRRNLFYSKYPAFVHWKTGRIHSSHRQCATNTRRASSSRPNMQQMPKHMKIEGQEARFREVVIPHKRNAVIVSVDFNAQELRVIADYSKDPNMVACYVGDNRKDMHIITGSEIMQRKFPDQDWSYEAFVKRYVGGHPGSALAKEGRASGKKVNFTTEYGAMAPKLAQTMLVDEATAQMFIDAREAAFPVAAAWKEGVTEEAKEKGYVLSKLGARRHLRELLNNEDRYISSKAERQAVNYKIQGSSAEMTKLAEGRMWRSGIFFRYDAICIGPIHDEIVCSVAVEDLYEFVKELHACMVERYADMEIPVESSIAFGPSFGDLVEAGDVATWETLENGFKLLNAAGKSYDISHVRGYSSNLVETV